MNSVEHPETEQLVAYSEQPESVEHQSTGLHLASCGQCRIDLEALSKLRRHAGWISTGPTESLDENAGDIVDLLNNRVSGEAAVELRNRIKQDPAGLREALHYARHHAAMRRNTRASTDPTPETSATGHSLWASAKSFITQSLQVETPVWKLIPVAVVLVAVVTVLGSFQTQSLQVTELIRFDDQPTIQFIAQETQPGIGFFANAKQTPIPFEGVVVQMHSEQQIAFSWPSIDNAQSYRLKLQVFRNGETVVLGRYTGKDSSTTISLSESLGQHRYEWVLTGDTIDNQSFQTTGGFVVAQ